MRKLLKALLVTAAASGVAYLVLDQLDLDAPSDSGGGMAGMDPDAMPDDDVQLLLKELGSLLG